jgi:hypothetical protein
MMPAQVWFDLAKTLASPLLILFVGAIIQRSFRAQDAQLSRIETSLLTLGTAVGSHAERLASGQVMIDNLRDRLGDLESRERDRRCYGPCPVCHPAQAKHTG